MFSFTLYQGIACLYVMECVITLQVMILSTNYVVVSELEICIN